MQPCHPVFDGGRGRAVPAAAAFQLSLGPQASSGAAFHFKHPVSNGDFVHTHEGNPLKALTAVTTSSRGCLLERGQTKAACLVLGEGGHDRLLVNGPLSSLSAQLGPLHTGVLTDVETHFNFFSLKKKMFIDGCVHICMYVCVLSHPCGDQRATWRSQLFHFH